jgi:hypothetical protein
MSSKPVVSFWEVTLKPSAACVEDGCGWRMADASIAACKEHVRSTGHNVIRTKTAKASYFVAGQ